MNDYSEILNQLNAALAPVFANLQSERDQMKAKFDALAAILSNDNQPPNPPTPPAIVAATPVRRSAALASQPKKIGVVKYPNALFLDAMTTSYQTQTELHRKLSVHGVCMGSVHARCMKLANDPTSGVEYGGRLGWRLKSPTKNDAPKTAKRTKVAALAKAPASKARAVKMIAANDWATLEPRLVNGCGLELLRTLPDASVPLILADLPYGVSRLGIDPKIDVQAWMDEMRRVVTDRGAIVAFAGQPFTTALITAGGDIFKQTLVWEKSTATGYVHCRGKHLKSHEDIVIFSKGTVINRRSKRNMTYNPQGAREVECVVRTGHNHFLEGHRLGQVGKEYTGLRDCPRSVLRFDKDGKLHPFQKPVGLLEYLIRTFSHPGELILDPSMGSGSAGVAAKLTGRRFIGAENGFDQKGQSIFSIAKHRIEEINLIAAA